LHPESFVGTFVGIKGFDFLGTLKIYQQQGFNSPGESRIYQQREAAMRTTNKLTEPAVRQSKAKEKQHKLSDGGEQPGSAREA